MISPKTETKVSPPRSYGWIAEYADENHLLEACRKVRDSGYTRTDAFAPFPVHGIDEALGIKPTVLPWIVLCFGLSGMSLACLMEWWMNAVSYPYIISGKPFFSLPAFIPVMFESTILFSVFSSFIAMILLNGLPKFSNPVFTNPKFDRATDDRFFLWVDSRDKYFNSDKVKTLLESTSPLSVDVVKEDDSSDVVPSSVWRFVAALILITLIPAAMVLRMRASKAEEPRWHVFFDMDFQPFKKAQDTTSIFADNRASRPPVQGTIARGDLEETDPYYLGYTPEDLALNALPAATRMVALQDDKQDEKKDEKSSDKQDDQSDAKSSDDRAATAARPDEGQAPAPVTKGGAAKDADKKSQDDAKGDDKPKAEKKPADDKKADDKKAESKPVDDKKANDKKAAAAKPAADEKKPAADKPAQEKTPAGKSAEEKPAVEQAHPNEPGAPAGSTAATEPERPWLTEFPFDSADEKMMALGKLKFETNCAVCHGFAGDGDGLVSQRALQLAQGYWVQPTNLHEPRVEKQPVGKIFDTITNGRGKMAPYGPVLNPKERWAIVLYVKALQRARNATLDDVPETQRAKLTAAPNK